MRKPKTNRVEQDANVSPVFDRCQTPPHGVWPLLPFLPPCSRIWEPASGDGWLAYWLRLAGHTVIESDLLTGYNFLTRHPPLDSFDLIITNPPFSRKYEFERRCLQLGKPWALLVPADTVAAAAHADLEEQYTSDDDPIQELRLRSRINYFMPETGYYNNGAAMMTWFLCYRLLPARIVRAPLGTAPAEHRTIKPPKPEDETPAHREAMLTAQRELWKTMHSAVIGQRDRQVLHGPLLEIPQQKMMELVLE